MFYEIFIRKLWVHSIEDVKKMLEDAEAMETDESEDLLNPFNKQGESQKGAGKRKVVSYFFENFLL